jgi:hypothetical protein
MKTVKLFFTVAILLVTVSFASAQSTNHIQPKSKTDTATKAVYTCPMHPEVISDKPGKCPKCGMTLVKKTIPAKNGTMNGMKMDGFMKGMKMDSTKH